MSPTGYREVADVNSHMPCCGLERLLLKRHGWHMAGVWHGHGMACMNQIQLPCVNRIGMTQSKSSATWHGQGMVGAQHGICDLALTGTRTLKLMHCLFV